MTTLPIEQQGLRATVWAAAFMAVIGIGFYFPTGSQAILLDGLFSLVGLFVSLLTLRVARLVQQPDDTEFQFGYGAFEPMLNLAKGFLIAGVCVFAVVPAISALFHGGRPLQSGPAILYAIIAAAGCFFMATTQFRHLKKVASPLLEVDARQWVMDGAISSVVAGAFIAGGILERTRLAPWVDYLDPVLVIVLVALSAGIPIGIIRSNLWEVLLGAPDVKTQRQLSRALLAVLNEHQLTEHRLRMVKTGRSHMILLHVRLPEEPPRPEVQALDALRGKLHDAVPASMQPFSLDVVFTSDARWMS